MSQPPVNIDDYVSDLSGRSVYVERNGNVTTGSTQYHVSKKRVVRSKPASQGTRYVNGWRSMTAWTRTWADGSVSGGNDGIRRISGPASPNPSDGMEQYWTNGSFWSPCLNRPPAPPFPNGMDSRAQIIALEKLHKSEFNLGIFLAEGKRTLSMVGNALQTIACQVLKWRRSNPVALWERVKRYQGTRNWRKVPNSWLALQYGWLPLMSDVMGAMHTLERGGVSDRPVVKVTGSASDTLKRPIELSGLLSPAVLVQEQEWKFKVRCTMYFELNNLQLANIASLGLVNPALIAWELVPYSFVIDWFLPVGRWLQSLTADVGFSFKAGCMSRKAECVETTKGLKNDFFTPQFRFFTGTDIKWEQGSFNRSLLLSSPVPGLYFKNPLSTLHVLNGLALLSQAFGRGRA